MDRLKIRDIIRNGALGEKADVCNRAFVLYVGNGFVDASKNTPQGAEDVVTCEKFLRGRCYRQFHGGQMEQVLDDLICISYIKTPREALSIVAELRKFGIKGEIRLEVEYIIGCSVDVTSY